MRGFFFVSARLDDYEMHTEGVGFVNEISQPLDKCENVPIFAADNMKHFFA